MLVLTIDTATTAASVGLVRDGAVAAATAVRDVAAAQHVLAAVHAALEEGGAARADIAAVAIGTGPGSFTGLRIGIATGLGLARGLGVPAIGVGTLDALRHAAGERAVAVVDARRGEVFAAGPDLPLAAYRPEDVARRLGPGALAIGDGVIAHRAAFADCAAPADDSPLHVPAPASLAALAGAGGPPSPVYVREPDAVPAAERA